MDTPIGQFVLIGNFRRRLARELLVITVVLDASTDRLPCKLATQPLQHRAQSGGAPFEVWHVGSITHRAKNAADLESRGEVKVPLLSGKQIRT